MTYNMAKTFVKKKGPHIHVFVEQDRKVLLHDEQEKANNGDSVGGPTVGYDILKQRICDCGAKETYDLQRTLI